MTTYQPYVLSRTLDESALAADFDGDARGLNYHVGDLAVYRRTMPGLPVWKYLPYDAIASAKAQTHRFLVGG